MITYNWHVFYSYKDCTAGDDNNDNDYTDDDDSVNNVVNESEKKLNDSNICEDDAKGEFSEELVTPKIKAK